MLTATLIQSFVHGGACAMIAIVYAVVLPGESTPLNKWYEFLNWMESKKGAFEMLSKPLGTCECCCAGQLALWTSFGLSGWALNELSIFSHFTAAAMAIVTTHFIGEAYKWKANK